MPTITQHAPGSFCWPELATLDAAAAKTFYMSLFGWTIVEHDMGPNGFYYIFQLGGRDAAAMFPMTPDMRERKVPPHWGAYVSVENVDEAAAKALSLGGTQVMAPFDVGENGRLSVFIDPIGAPINLWQGKSTPGVGVMYEHGALAWTQLNATDPAKAKAFYEPLLGWKGNDTQNPMGGAYTQWANAVGMAAGMMPMPPDAPGSSHWLTYFAVDDVDAAHAKLASLGGKTWVPPMDIPGVGRFCVVADPQGGTFAMAKFLPPPEGAKDC